MLRASSNFRICLIGSLLILMACNNSGGGGGQNNGSSNASGPCNAFEATLDASVTLTDAFADLTFEQPVALLQHPDNDQRWYVVEQSGAVRTFENASADAYDTFIDISDRLTSGGEAGLLGMAFHPDFTTNQRFYLSYTQPGSPLTSVVAAYTASSATSADPAGESILFSQPQPFYNHNGGWIAFGPDEMLYLGLGDGGSAGDPLGNGQNPQTVLGSILRIDIDQSDTARGTPYAIPAGNPFSDSQSCAAGEGCPEIFAFGLRNPWRCSFDGLTGDLWCGDVGQNAWEEIDLIEVGGNYGWNVLEGLHCYNAASCDSAAMTPPVVEYDHNAGSSVTGGFVYRGSELAGFQGDYIFGDFGSGNIWRIVNAAQGGNDMELLLSSGLNISSFAQDRNGELYIISYGDGRIYRLSPESTSSELAPQRLSQTGYFSSADPAQPIDCFIPYDVNAPFWSDGAQKERWLGLPDNETIAISNAADWQLPIGSVVIKTFKLEDTPIETRLLLRHENGQWAGYSYQWTEDGSDAVLTSGKTVAVNDQDWIFPSQNDCLQCHSASAGRTLGLETGQLNGEMLYPQESASLNQLEYLDQNGLLSPALTVSADQLSVLPDPFDQTVDIGERARAYLHTNCAQCHRPGGPTSSNMDLRNAAELNAMNICNEMVDGTDLGISDARRLVPQDPARSILLQRILLRNDAAMPPIGSSLPDTDGADLLQTWITELSTCP